MSPSTTHNSGPLCILVPGLSGFDPTGTPLVEFANFRGVAAALAKLGVDCRTAAGIPPSGPVEARARALKKFLDGSAADRVVLIGHSMGGLDSRFLAAELDPGHRVAALVTLATPHRGSSVANWALAAHGPVPWLVRAIGRDGVMDLTPEACARRNLALKPRPDLPILSVAAARPAAELSRLFRTLVPGLLAEEGPNDGLVTVASAQWGEFYGTVRADHFELIGIDLTLGGLPLVGPRLAVRAPFDYLALYRKVWGWAAAHAARG